MDCAIVKRNQSHVSCPSKPQSDIIRLANRLVGVCAKKKISRTWVLCFNITCVALLRDCTNVKYKRRLFYFHLTPVYPIFARYDVHGNFIVFYRFLDRPLTYRFPAVPMKIAYLVAISTWACPWPRRLWSTPILDCPTCPVRFSRNWWHSNTDTPNACGPGTLCAVLLTRSVGISSCRITVE